MYAKVSEGTARVCPMGVETFRPSSVIPYHDVFAVLLFSSVVVNGSCPGTRGVKIFSSPNDFLLCGMWWTPVADWVPSTPAEMGDATVSLSLSLLDGVVAEDFIFLISSHGGISKHRIPTSL